MDGTFRACLPILGQGKFSDPEHVRASFPFHGKEACTRVVTLRGRSGAVLGMEPVHSESGADLRACLLKALPEEALQQVQHVATDNPSKQLLEDLRVACPKLTGVSLDPTHTAMKYEQALGGRKSAGSSLVRSLMAKFCSHDPALEGNIWGCMYMGSNPVPLSAQEVRVREHILTSSWPRARSARILALSVWPTRLQFVEAIAALSATHSTDMTRKLEGTKLNVARLLYNITSAEKIDWLFNNLRYRQVLPAVVRQLLPSGTTSNEALHAEMNTWFRQVQAMHRSTLQLKLQIQSLAKLLAHQTALHSPTASQMSQMHLGPKVSRFVSAVRICISFAMKF